MKKLTRALALSAAVTIAGFGGSLGAVAQDAPPPPEAPAAPEAPEAQPEESPEGIGSESSLSEVSQKNLSDFGSCIASEKSADLLFVLDQSASLVGYEGSQPTDADAFRVDATGDIVKQLAHLGEDNGADINVKLAGFGSDYYSDPA